MNDIPAPLLKFREDIDALDQALIDILAKRYAVVRNVGHFKKDAQMDAVQPQRAQAVKDAAVALGVQKGMSEEFMRALYDLLIDHAHEIEHEILGDSHE